MAAHRRLHKRRGEEAAAAGRSEPLLPVEQQQLDQLARRHAEAHLGVLKRPGVDGPRELTGGHAERGKQRSQSEVRPLFS